jgi:hypothetical protein
MYTSTVKEEEIMTDFQFKTILKMVRGIVQTAESVEEVDAALAELIGEKDEKPKKPARQKKAN